MTETMAHGYLLESTTLVQHESVYRFSLLLQNDAK